MASTLNIRLATTTDQPAIIDLINTIFIEYGAEICLEGAEADLLDIETNYITPGGIFWVLESISEENSNSIVGSHSAIPLNEPGICTFKRLYVAKHLRGTEWSHRLMQVAIDWARDQGFRQVQFWSDTRFARAHRFFGKFGFRKTGQVRHMDDSSDPYSEYFFVLDL